MYQIIIGSYNVLSETDKKCPGIHIGTFHPASGQIIIKNEYDISPNPSFLCISPEQTYLAAVNELPENGGIDTYSIQKDGSLRHISKLPIQGSACCYIEYSPTGKFLVGTNYGDGSIFSCAFDSEGTIQHCTSFIQHRGSGTISERQEHAHAHSIRYYPVGDIFIACDLGADALFLYKYTKDGTLIPYEEQSIVKTPDGFGPRHMDYVIDQKYLYVVGELSNQVLVYEYAQGRLYERQVISTLPSNYHAYNLAADIHIHPNGRWLYVSNRGHDSITQYIINPDGTLKWINSYSCNGKWPRNFALCKTHLICANQESNNIIVFQLGSSGELKLQAKQEKIHAPTCIQLLDA